MSESTKIEKSSLPPKNERIENLKWVKWSAIFSWIAVLWTIFSWWMAYNASVSSAEISWKMSKENEIETRLYQQKYELYKNIWKAFIEYNNEWKDKSYPERAKILERKLLNLWYEIRVIWSNEVICAYTYLLLTIGDYIEFTTKESPAHGYTDFWRDVIPMIFDLEHAMRRDLVKDTNYKDSLELEINESSLEWMAVWLPRCSEHFGNITIPLQQYR